MRILARMRRLWTHVEELAPAPFIVLVGVVGGALQGIPRFFLATTNSTGAKFAEIAVFVADTGLWWAAAFLLWWAAVHRRQFSIWKTAWHVTLALLLADVLDLVLAYADASMTTGGEYARALVHAPLSVSSSGLVLVLFRIPFRYILSALLIALGRHLPVRGDRRAARAEA